jgi:predicted phage terminase large subunit-like protein
MFTREVFFGGAGGGGKSEALWYAALQYVDVPGYAALILRRTYADLAKPGALMDRSKEMLAGTSARWNERDKRWTFPSGASISFGYLDNENDKYQYASAEFQFLSFDELTHFSESQYSFLFTRLRKKSAGSLGNVPLRMRSASNPGGVGHEWVYRRFIDDALRKPGRIFIPAKMDDNPALDRDGYRESLANTDPITRRQIEDGDWNAFAGGRFKREWLRHYRSEPGSNWLRFGEKLYTGDELQDRFITVDPAATVKTVAKSDPDWTVISSWARTPCGLLVWLGCRMVRCEIPEIPAHVWNEYQRHRAGKAYVEGFGIGKGAAQACQRHSGRMNIIEFAPTKDKLVTATNAMNMMEAGRVWLPSDVPGFPLDDVEAQLLRFTGNAKTDSHDDIIDTLSQAANVVMGREPKQPGTGYRGSVAVPGLKNL